MSDTLKKTDEGQPVKRPYQGPKLTVYGDLRLSTWTKSSGPTSDGGSHPNNMT